MVRLRHSPGPGAHLDCLLKDAALYLHGVCSFSLANGPFNSCLQPSHKHPTSFRSFSELFEMSSYAPTARLVALMTTMVMCSHPILSHISHSLPDLAAFYAIQSHVVFILESSIRCSTYHHRRPWASGHNALHRVCPSETTNLTTYSRTIGSTLLYSSLCPAGV